MEEEEMEEEEAEEEEESVGRVDSTIEDEISLHSDVVKNPELNKFRTESASKQT